MSRRFSLPHCVGCHRLDGVSTITAYGHYDNSTKNPHNPAPDAAVRFGPQSTDEMYIPFMEVSVDAEDLRQKRLEEFLR